MDDPTPMDIEPQPALPVTYEIVEEGSKRRCKKLIDSIGYSYTFKEKTKTTSYWQCSVRPKVNPCRATVKEQDGSFIPGRNTHNHQPEPGALLAAKIVTCVKQKALDNVFKPATAIVDEVSVITFKEGGGRSEKMIKNLNRVTQFKINLKIIQKLQCYGR